MPCLFCQVIGPGRREPTTEEILASAERLRRAFKEAMMHYKNGREAKNGDKVVVFPTYPAGAAPCVGILYDATPGNDFCNGKIAPVKPTDPGANLQECLHLDDVKALFPADGSEKGSGLSKVPDSSKG